MEEQELVAQLIALPTHIAVATKQAEDLRYYIEKERLDLLVDRTKKFIELRGDQDKKVAVADAERIIEAAEEYTARERKLLDLEHDLRVKVLEVELSQNEFKGVRKIADLKVAATQHLVAN